jgi:hypothetical protein
MQARNVLGNSAGAAVLAFVAISVTACGPEVVAPPVTVVATHTPGLKYVIVRHSALRDDFGSKAAFSKASDYILLCDGRAVDGMHCIIPPEVGLHASVGPTLPQAPAPVPSLIGELAGVSEEHLSVAAPAPAAAGPAPNIPVIVPVVPSPSVHVAPAVKGGR